MSNYQPVPDDTMDEILAGAGTVENKAETAVAFLEEWSTWIADLFTIFKNFFDKITAAFNSAE